jgi:chemotaxis response regulator CheB
MNMNGHRRPSMNHAITNNVHHKEQRNIVVIGASAGGVEALSALVAGLPPTFPAAILVVLHIPSHSPSMLHHILYHAGPLPAAPAVSMLPWPTAT